MKTASLVIGLFFCLQSSAQSSVALQHSPHFNNSPIAFQFLRGHSQGHNYALQWNMTNNAGIVRFEVQSTYEDPFDPYSNWLSLGSIESGRRNLFHFSDHPAWPGIINYRVIAYLRNGSTLVSDCLTTVIN
ncbi:MAG TPA: hypothetical protein PKK69_01780 [Ferruginibacter sp.]|nr:hypothetical protein [Ferruginibacter sp.]